jgi:ribonucleotide reductase alpha subunit
MPESQSGSTAQTIATNAAEMLQALKSEWSPFARTIAEQKYCHELKDGSRETWEQVARRVASNVMKAVDAPKELVARVERAIANREFMPGGRYLYASGRPLHQVQNCLLMRAADSREGWAEVMQKSAMALMTGAGIGIVYSDLREEGARIRKTGGSASGPVALMQMVNEAGRFIMQGGSRRSAIWAGLHWNHPDIMKFIHIKDWSPELRDLKARDYNFPAPLDGTNVSVILDDEFFKAFANEKHPLHSMAKNVYWETVRQMLKKAEPGFSIDTGVNNAENLRNAPVCAGTHVLTDRGYQDVANLVGTPTSVWTGKRWANDVVFKETNPAADVVRVDLTGGRTIRCDATHPFLIERYDGKGDRRRLVGVERVPASALQPGDVAHVSLPKGKWVKPTIDSDAYALGYVYGDGSFGNQGRNAEITFCSLESKACVGLCLQAKLFSSVNHCDGRGFTRVYFKSDDYWAGRDKAAFPVEMYSASPPEALSFLAGLFDADGNWELQQKRIRLASVHEGFLRGVARLLEQYGILSGVSKAGHSTYGKSQTYQLVVMSEYTKLFAMLVPTIRLEPDLAGYSSYRHSSVKVLNVEPDGIEPVYCADVGVEEHSFMAEGVVISNCTEVTSDTTDDICNLGSINMARVRDLAHMKELVDVAVAFLVAGTVYSDLPYPDVDKVRTKNRRLGLGLMGIHEWLLKHGKKYGPDEDLKGYLEVYATSTEVAHKWEKEWDLSKSKKTRAIAPTGTIGIVAETTTGIEPLFCVAYKRRYLKGTVWHAQYVIDPTAKRLIESGVNPDSIEDAYSLAEDVERRVAFQAWVQQYVDHAISSTINLPEWGSEHNNESTVRPFGNMLLRYLPKLRGVTCYPDGARGGQPLNAVKYSTAAKHIGEVMVEQADVCDITRGGTCGA